MWLAVKSSRSIRLKSIVEESRPESRVSVLNVVVDEVVGVKGVEVTCLSLVVGTGDSVMWRNSEGVCVSRVGCSKGCSIVRSWEGGERWGTVGRMIEEEMLTDPEDKT